MAAKERKRKILLILGGVLGGLALVLASLPLWFPWAGRPLFARFDIHYAKYERAGYGRFVLTDVAFTSGNVRLQAERVSAPVPTAWLLRRWLNSQSTAILRVENWQLEFSQSKAARRTGPTSVYESFKVFELILSKVREWVPTAFLTNGLILEAGESVPRARFPSATWLYGTLSANVELGPAAPSPTLPISRLLGPKPGGTLHAKLGSVPHEIAFESIPLQFRSVTLISQSADGLVARSTNFWGSNRVEVSAQFGREGLLPEQAAARAESLRVPAELLGLKQAGDVTGAFSFQWSQKQFAFSLNANAPPAEPSKLPPFEVRIQTTGSMESAFIEVAKISSPWLRAELSPGVEVKFAPPFLRQDAVFTVAIDLGRQPWFPATGTLDGQVKLGPGQGRFPAASFVLSGAGIKLTNFQSRTVGLNGTLLWPWLEVSRMSAELADGSTASLVGRLDLDGRVAQGGILRCNGTFGREFLPPGYSFKQAAMEFRFSGPLANLAHSGQMKIEEWISPKMRPMQVQADWEGEGLNRAQAQIAAGAGASLINFRGVLGVTNTEARLKVEKLTLERNRTALLELEKTCEIFLRPDESRANPPISAWLVRLTPFHWVGKGGEVKVEGELDWPVNGKLAGMAHSLGLEAFEDFLAIPVAAARVADLNWSMQWSNGPAKVVLQGVAEASQDGVPFVAEVAIKADEKGLSIDRLAVSGTNRPILSAHGLLPMTLTPSRQKQLLTFLPNQPLQLQAMTETNSVFWESVARSTGLILSDPEMQVNIAGSWQAPRGKVEMKVKRIRMPLKKWVNSSTQKPVPTAAVRPKSEVKAGSREPASTDGLTFEDFQLSMDLEQGKAQVESLSLRLQGSPMTFTGELPLGKSFWDRLQAGQPRVDWERASGRFRMDETPIAAFAPLLPKGFSTDGTLKLDVAALPGLKFDGELVVSGASTLPLGNFGVIRDIQAKARFQERTIKLAGATASISGAPISLTGSVDLSGTEWLDGVLPPFDLKAHGLNVPLARTQDFIVRSDLDLQAVNPRKGPGTITGEARLRDSLYLRDFKELLPGGVATPERRPPYFSVETEPWGRWRLDLTLHGNRFMKVHSPLFRGLVSADLKLAGTLRDPVALGNVRIDSGVVQFPFANLEVKQGFVTLTSDNPYRPQLAVSAVARSAGYDVRMEVSGSADQPLVQFSSTPPLASEQIVLMLTAGVLPTSEASITTQQRAGRVALYLGKNLLSEFGVGGQSDRLTIRSGEEISETGRSTYHVEYKLSNRWFLVGEYDQFNAFNVGFRWRIYSK